MATYTLATCTTELSVVGYNYSTCFPEFQIIAGPPPVTVPEFPLGGAESFLPPLTTAFYHGAGSLGTTSPESLAMGPS